MQEIVRAYGKFLITGLVTLTALTWVFFYGFYGGDGRESNGMMELVGNEAAIKQEDIGKNRVGFELEAVGTDDVSITCLTNPIVGESIRLTDAFVAEEVSSGGNKTYPFVVTDVVDEQGKRLGESNQMTLLENGELTINQAGIYRFYVKVLPCRKTELFTICVTEKGEA